jgi:guanylate cyclase
MYTYVFGVGLTAALPLLFTVVVGASLGVSHLTKNHYFTVYSQIICIIYLTAFIQWSIGGVFASGFVLAWSFLGPVVALIFFSLRGALVWFGLCLVNLAITVIFDETFAQFALDSSTRTRVVFFVMNLAGSSFIVFLFAGHFVRSAAVERRRAANLLLNILPKSIATRLKADPGTIADHYECASVMFADMVGSTPLFAGLSPADTVEWLNEAFTLFDRLIEKHGVEKIRTIGDNYMVAAGVPTERSDHAHVLTQLALDMAECVETLTPRNGKRMRFRFGIHSGPLVAGVIGETKFQYDLWGDTVNIASRMESHGEVGRVHVSAVTHAIIQDAFECSCRGTVPIKGRGEMETWWVEGPRPAAPGPGD